MALLWIDGFAHYSQSSTTPVSTALTLGAYEQGGRSFRILTHPELGILSLFLYGSVTNATDFAIKRVLNSGTTDRSYGVGCDIYIPGLSGYPGFYSFANSAEHLFRISRTNLGEVVITAGTATDNRLATSTNTLEAGGSYHFETKLTAHATQGSIEVRVNGQTWVVADGLDTTGVIDSIRFGTRTIGSGSVDGVYLNNLYIWDDTGTENNDWLGERNVYTLFPVADGPTQDWSRSTGVDTYALLNDVPDDIDTYIQAATMGDTAQIAYDELPSLDITPNGVMLLARGLKTGTAGAEASVALTGESSTPFPLTQDQSAYFTSGMYEINPATGQPWTPAEINAIQADITRTL